MANRSLNPNKYGPVNDLGANTRIRHMYILRRVLADAFRVGNIEKLSLTTGRPTGILVDSDWIWGEIGKRIGGRRSADGMLYDLPTARTNSTANGNKVVIKLIFSNNDDPENEVKIANIASNERIGPKVFAAYRCRIPTAVQIASNIRRYGKELVKANGTRYINLFQQYWSDRFDLKEIRFMYMIVMENLFSNPSKGVVDGKTLDDLAGRNPPPGWRVPRDAIRRLLNKLHTLGIIHGDMHSGNIVIQKIRKPNGTNSFGARIIDYGRSIKTGMRFNSNAAANRALEGLGSTTERYPAHINVNGILRLRNGIAWGRVLGATGITRTPVLSARQDLARNAAAARQRNAVAARQRNAVAARQRNAVAARQRNAVAARQRNAVAARQRNAVAARQRNAVAVRAVRRNMPSPMNWRPPNRRPIAVNMPSPMNWSPTIRRPIAVNMMEIN